MIAGKLRRSGNSFIVTVPREEVDRLGLVEGQTVILSVSPAEVRPVLTADLREACKAERDAGREALDYLAR